MMAALLNRRSIRPTPRWRRPASGRPPPDPTARPRPRSPGSPPASSPSSSRVCAAPRLCRTTLQPRSARPRAIRFPIPRLAPVTSAHFPLIRASWRPLMAEAVRLLAARKALRRRSAPRGTPPGWRRARGAHSGARPAPRSAPPADLQAAAEAAQDEQSSPRADVADARARDLRADAGEDRPGAEQLDRVASRSRAAAPSGSSALRAGDVEDHVGRPLRHDRRERPLSELAAALRVELADEAAPPRACPGRRRGSAPRGSGSAAVAPPRGRASGSAGR